MRNHAITNVKASFDPLPRVKVDGEDGLLAFGLLVSAEWLCEVCLEGREERQEKRQK